MIKRIRGIYKGNICKKGEYGIAPKMLFIDLYADDQFLCSSYDFSLLKSFGSFAALTTGNTVNLPWSCCESHAEREGLA